MNMLYNRLLIALFLLISSSSVYSASVQSSKVAHPFYTSSFKPSSVEAKDILYKGQILAEDEGPSEMIDRVINAIAQAEKTYQLKSVGRLDTKKFAQQLGQLCDEGAIVFSTPILTNAGRFDDRPLSACAMPPVDLKGDMKKIKQMADQYHQDGMGTGYNLSDIVDPVKMLRYLNEIAVEGAASNKEQRPVGNMAILDVDHPKIIEFIQAKIDSDAKGENWKFNISVNVNDAFMDAAKHDQTFTLKDGSTVQAKDLLEKMAQAAHNCGDPGIISIDRLNEDNPTPLVNQYKTTAPCAEVGLAPGETCVFGYINVGSFFSDKHQAEYIDFEKLHKTIFLMTRALDNILQISIEHYATPESEDIMKKKRKIGIGICGFADLLIKCNISYTDKKAQNLLKDILNFISYHSKVASVQLAEVRGSFKAIEQSRYMDESFLLNKYKATPHVSEKQWSDLAQKIKTTKMLRHATTTALPPTGRSATVIGASQSIEPIFSFKTADGLHVLLEAYLKEKNISPEIIEKIKKSGSCASLPGQHPFITATEIAYKDHMTMTIAAQGAIDESIAKTVNVPEGIDSQLMMEIYQEAYANGLKGMTVFRDGCRSYQPKPLSK